MSLIYKITSDPAQNLVGPHMQPLESQTVYHSVVHIGAYNPASFWSICMLSHGMGKQPKKTYDAFPISDL